MYQYVPKASHPLLETRSKANSVQYGIPNNETSDRTNGGACIVQRGAPPDKSSFYYRAQFVEGLASPLCPAGVPSKLPRLEKPQLCLLEAFLKLLETGVFDKVLSVLCLSHCLDSYCVGNPYRKGEAMVDGDLLVEQSYGLLWLRGRAQKRVLLHVVSVPAPREHEPLRFWASRTSYTVLCPNWGTFHYSIFKRGRPIIWCREHMNINAGHCCHTDSSGLG